MSNQAASGAVDLAFKKAVRDFKSKLKNDDLYQEIQKATSIDDVYDLTDKLQQEQGKRGHLRHLSKLHKYLTRLNTYCAAIDTFVQAKPDVLSLIWGPIKLLIQWASTLKKSQDAIVNMAEEIGDLLPDFKEMAELFSDNTPLTEVLVLFFNDIMDFYLVTLQFFSMARWRYFFESLWPRQIEKIELVKSHIERHSDLIKSKIDWEHIRREHEAREKALEHFEKTDREDRRQEFYRIQCNISPKFYDDKLSWIFLRLCEGTGGWLLRDSTFTQWLDHQNSTSNVLWLEGIPGAGKTFLAGTVITKCQSERGKTIYAFPTHEHVTSTSALSIFHSLIFQLASGDEQLQACLCQLAREHLNTRLAVATTILKSLLECAGPTYLVIDGVDEVDKVEREHLLLKLIEIAKECSAVKLLISSRGEEDIEKILCRSAQIRVHEKNWGSIQAFVERRGTEWLDKKGFPPDDREEIERLLAPIAYKCQGMFLYGKIIFDYLEFRVHTKDVRNELKVLPEDLDDIYARVLTRINHIPSRTTQSNALQILSFVGASPTPLTISELGQLLDLRPGSKQDFDLDSDLEEEFDFTFDSDQGQGISLPISVDLVDSCRPIIEVVDEYVRFVHFTVKEYIFSPEIANCVPEKTAAIDLTTSCLAYLCQNHHDSELCEAEVESEILRGSYRLHGYAETMWLSLVEKCLALGGSNPVPPGFLAALEYFIETRSSVSPDGCPEPSTCSIHRSTEKLHDGHPEIYRFLLQAAEFRRQYSSTDFQFSEGNLPEGAKIEAPKPELTYHLQGIERWVHLDPLNTPHLSITIHKTFERLLARPSKREALIELYGHYPFKCQFLGCPSRRRGFKSTTSWSSHTKNHKRPWKCNVEGCEYGETGFVSARMRDDHLDFFHRGDQLKLSAQTSLDGIDKDQIQPLLIDLVRADRTLEVKRALEHFQDLGLATESLILTSGEFASVKMMIILLNHMRFSSDHQRKSIENSITERAIQGENIELARWVLDDHRPWGFAPSRYKRLDFLRLAFLVDSDDMFETFALESIGYLTSEGSLDRFVGLHLAVREVRNLEARLIFVWENLHRLGAFRNNRLLGEGLAIVSRRYQFVWLSKILIDLGAEVDYQQFKPRLTLTPIHYCLLKKSRRAAELAKLLLYKGANPRPKCYRRVRVLSESPGAKGIAQWLGMDWDELVARIEADREAGFCPPEYR